MSEKAGKFKFKKQYGVAGNPITSYFSSQSSSKVRLHSSYVLSRLIEITYYLLIFRMSVKRGHLHPLLVHL